MKQANTHAYYSIIMIWTIVSILSMIGCTASSLIPAASGAKFSGVPPVGANEANIVIYRPPLAINSGTYPYIYIDRAKKARLENGGYLVLPVQPGDHLVEAKGSFMHWDTRAGVVASDLNTHIGKTYFLRFRIIPIRAYASGRHDVRCSFELVGSEVALKELESLRLSK